jgi:hypothetical protein
MPTTAPPDHSKPWRITGSAALEDAARAAGRPSLSALVDEAVRALLTREGREVPPPYLPGKRGPKTKEVPRG